MAKEIREATGWTETELSKALGVSQPTVNRILAGQKDCKSSTYLKLLELYNEVAK